MKFSQAVNASTGAHVTDTGAQAARIVLPASQISLGSISPKKGTKHQLFVICLKFLCAAMCKRSRKQPQLLSVMRRPELFLSER